MNPVTGLVRFRHQIDREMEGDWTTLEAPVVSMLSEVCQALDLSAGDRFRVLGHSGLQYLANLQENRSYFFPSHCDIEHDHRHNHRQRKAMAYVQRRGRIDLAAYRRVCPHWVSETLRLDLAGLVKAGLLVRKGRTKGTYYTLGEEPGR